MNDSIEEENASTLNLLKQWAHSQKTEIEARNQHHLRTLNEVKSEIQRLQQRKDELEAEIRKANEDRGKQKLQTLATKSEISQLESELSRLRPVLAELRTQSVQEEQQFKYKQSEISRLARAREEKRGACRRDIELYEALGLFFEPLSDNNIAVKFTQIDSRDPGREFVFHVRIDADSSDYVVDFCSPEVDMRDRLVHQLNETGNFAAFVQTMRKEFKRSVN